MNKLSDNSMRIEKQNRLYFNRINQMYKDSFEIFIGDYLAKFKVDVGFRQNLFIKIKDEILLPKMHDALNIYISSFGEKISSSLPTEDKIERILKSKRGKIDLEFQLDLILARVVDRTFDIVNFLTETPIIEKNQEYKMLREDSLELQAKKEILAAFIDDKNLSLRQACKRVYDKYYFKDKYDDFQSFYVAFDHWYKRTINQNKYPEIKTFLNELNRRKNNSESNL